MVVSTINDIPNLQQMVDQGKVTYRGLGMGVVSSRFYDLAGESGVEIRIGKDKYYITSVDFNKLGGVKKIKFAAPFRKG